MDPEAPMDADAGMDMPADEFAGDETEAGEDNPVGRELKGESALADMEGKALSEKKFLESKDRLFKMVESGKMTQEHFINIINQLDEYDSSRNRITDFEKSLIDPSVIAPSTKGGPSKLKQRQMQKQQGGNLPDAPSGPPQDIQGGLGPSIPKAFDDYPFNRFAPPPTGPGGDEALPTKPQPKPRRMMPRGEFRAQPRTGPMRFADVAKAKSG